MTTDTVNGFHITCVILVFNLLTLSVYLVMVISEKRHGIKFDILKLWFILCGDLLVHGYYVKVDEIYIL